MLWGTTAITTMNKMNMKPEANQFKFNATEVTLIL